MRTPTGDEVEIKHVKELANGGARFDITADDGRKWRVDITRTGSIDLVTTWRDGVLEDLDEPDWMTDVIARLQRAA
ncbi:hypothetical protein HLRTI_002323 [Halorhabdus tiamatea SARL4B]|uniref:Uncharacterized protein n=1 Tax=Halorhabdus tiamatea SARL4B TaxID=1033806 RepID=F7PQR4_9EURY|nr:hypothetical protein [Halorhabdus tiamatea]ERJ05701.1 hypothetical protein HLRTI_002323 [Halorhabdus tiamatea SARL4B]CCQ34914.1 conserved hypothetical protein [Halorhabdus tiamatea SARL4B]